MAATRSTDSSASGAEGFSESEGKFLLELARDSISHFFEEGKELELKESELPSLRLAEKGASFVTLTIGGGLRGCIGTLEAERKLYLDVISNAVLAAFNDPRFPPLTRIEFAEAKIEVSVLSKPVESSVQDIVQKKHGAIISFHGRRATFLPQVWEELPEKEKFFSHLCLKAGLPSEAWKEKDFRVWAYEVQAFHE